MKVDIIISADDIKEEKVKDKVVVVVDMLRATSVITTAIHSGALSVIPVVTIEEALEIYREDKDNYILGGERKAMKIEGFHCSNSPLEYTEELVDGKHIILTTSNGTRAIKACESASYIFIGAMINAMAVAEKLLEIKEDVVIVNAGTYGEFSMDDFICAGYIINCMQEKLDLQLSDIAKTANYIYAHNRDIISFIQNASHYKRIQDLKLQDDLNYCCRKDIIGIVPEYVDGAIKL